MKYYINSTTQQINGSSLLQDSRYPVKWIIGYVINIILIIWSILLIVSISVNSNICGSFENEESKNHLKPVFVLATITSLLTLLRLILTHLLFWIGFNNDSLDQFCEIVMDMSVVVYALVHVAVYSLFWLREQFIYKQPSVILLNTKKIKILNCIFLCFLFVCNGLLLVVFVEPQSNQSTMNGCYHYRGQSEEDLNLPFSVYYISSAIAIGFEIGFIALLLYPLLCLWSKVNRNSPKNKKSPSNIPSNSNKSINYKTNNTDTELTTTLASSQIVSKISAETTKVSAENFEREFQKTDSFKASKQQILQVLRRIAVCSSLCFISDMTAVAVVGMIFKGTQPRYLSTTIYDIVMVLRIFFFLRSFENYEKIVCFIFFTKVLFV